MERNKVLGALYGAAYGDSLGAITEFCTQKEIKKAFPEGLDDYQKSISRITQGIVPGSVTDDFGSCCYFMKAVLKNHGQFNRLIATDAILEWSKDEEVFKKYAGQNTKKAVERLKSGVAADEESKRRHFAQMNTNGAAMKASFAGVLAGKDRSQAVEYALDLAWPTHYNSAAAAGAGAMVCAIAEALKEQTTLEQVVEEAVFGAKTVRLKLEEAGWEAFGPYLDERIQTAVQLAKQAQSKEEMMSLLNGVIGTGIAVQESVAAALAIVAFSWGDLNEAIKIAVNAGGDTDTIASMVGAILGAVHGVTAIKKTVVEKIKEANRFLELEQTIEQFAEMMLSNRGGY